MEALDTPFVRGFSNSFLPNKKLEVTDANLQFIEGGELARAWKAACRQRLKQQEDKIWNEFVKEQDILHNICTEDPYQFLTQLPEEQIKDLIDSEIPKMKQNAEVSKEQKRGAGDSPRDRAPTHQPTVTFSQVEHDEVFHIFDDEDKEEDDSDNENLNDTLESPCTVRERDEEMSERANTVGRASGLSVPPSYTNLKTEPENVATVIESSIYCAKVKDLRLKMDAELRQMIIGIENLNITSLDPWTLRKMCYRASEYSARFQRIHLYQLQRQTGDIKRHNAMALPYAKHTQFQSQMVRIVTLHQNTLSSLQVFHKSFEQTACLRECADQLCSLCETIRESTKACLEVPSPTDFMAAKELYNDNVVETCTMLETTVKEHVRRVCEYIAVAEEAHNARNKKVIKKKKKSIGSWSQRATKNTSKKESHLSMYSMDTLRLNQKGSSRNTVKLPIHERLHDSHKKKGDKDTPKSHRKSPRSRRPLMRDPHSGAERKRPNRQQPDTDIHTMVEAVEPPSSQMSREVSPHTGHNQAPSALSPRKRQHPHKLPSPRTPPRKASPPPPPTEASVPAPPKSTHPPPAHLPAIRGIRKPAKMSPRAPQFKRTSPYVKPITNQRLDTQDTTSGFQSSNEPLSPVMKIKIQSNSTDLDEIETATLSECTFKLSISEKTRQDGGKTPKSQKSSRTLLGSARSDMNRKMDAQPISSRSDNSGAQDSEKGCQVSKLLKQLCGGDSAAGSTNRNERVTGAKNAQLVCVGNTSPRQPTTPQLLRILEETIQKKIPKQLYMHHKSKDDRLRLAFNIPQKIADSLFQYRTKFVQHMLTSSMYANSSVGKPWEMVGSVSEQIIDEVIMQCAKELQLSTVLQELVKTETR